MSYVSVLVEGLETISSKLCKVEKTDDWELLAAEQDTRRWPW